MDISLILVCVSKTSTRSWKFQAQLASGESLGSLILEDPALSFEEKEVVWYLEEFALQDPYSKARAQVVSHHLQDYATRLANFLKPSILAVSEIVQPEEIASLTIYVQGSETTSDVHHIKWELLERQTACIELGHPDMAIMVIREVLPITPRVNERQPDTISNILFLTARQTIGDAIPYRIISQSVWDIAKAARKKGHSVQLFFVRPGTWQNLTSVLARHPKGFFSVVHFDVHGMRKSDGSFHLQLSPKTFTAQSCESRPSEEIAELLSTHGIRIVSLNACNSGNQPPDAGLKSLASIFVSAGIREVVAMSYAVLKDSATHFMTIFYKELLEEQSTVARAVFHARRYLRSHATKSGRFMLPVEVNDDFLPVLYQCYMSEESFFLQPREGSTQPPAPDICHTGSLEGKLEAEKIIGREQDLLAVEVAISEYEVVKVTSDHGAGKTSFANHLSHWWLETGFVHHFFAIEFENLSEGVMEEIFAQMERTCETSDIPSERLQSVFCIDNYNTQDTEGASIQRMEFLHDSISHVNKRYAHSRWILLCHPSEKTSAIDDVSFTEYPLERLTMKEAVQFMKAGQTSRTSVFASGQPEAYEQLEDLLDHHSYNPLTLRMLKPLLSFNTPSLEAILQKLKFNLPIVTAVSLDVAFRQNEELRKSSHSMELRSYFNGPSNTLKAFTRMMKILMETSNFAFQIALTLSTFQQTVPFEIGTWVAQLSNIFNWSALDNRDEANSHITTDEEGALLAGSPLQDSISWTFHQLEKSGFITSVPSRSTESAIKHFNIHPLLPYLLRYEIVMNRHARLTLEHLPSILWSMYELRIESISKAAVGSEQSAGVPGLVREFLGAEHANIYNAIEALVQHPDFGFQDMNLLGILLSEAVVELYPPQARAQASLLNRVLSQFELVVHEERYISALNDNESLKALVMIMTLVWWRGNTLLAMTDHSAALDNSKRGLALLDNLPDSLSGNPDLNGLQYGLKCQAASIRSNSSPPDTLAQLLANDCPSGANSMVMRIFDFSKHLIKTRWLQAEGGAAGPDGLSFKQLAALYVHVLRLPGVRGTFQNEELILSLLEDETLDEQRWLAVVKPALERAFINTGYELPHGAASLYIWKANLLRNEKGPDRECLQRAVEVARQINDLKSEVNGLDGLFLLARGEDVRAAIEIHTKINDLEPRMAAQGMSWNRTGALERNYSIGNHFIPNRDTDPDAGDSYNQARIYLERAISLEPPNPSEDAMQVLSQAHICLSFCANFEGKRAEYYLNQLKAMRFKHLINTAQLSGNESRGGVMRELFDEIQSSMARSELSTLIGQLATVAGYSPEEVMSLLEQATVFTATAAISRVREVLQEAQDILFGPKELVQRFWQHDERGFTLIC